MESSFLEDDKSPATVSGNSNKKNERIFFNLDQLEGDKKIFLGQSIVALCRLNQSIAYSDKQNKGFLVEMFVSILEKLDISAEDLLKEFKKREREKLSGIE